MSYSDSIQIILHFKSGIIEKDTVFLDFVFDRDLGACTGRFAPHSTSGRYN